MAGRDSGKGCSRGNGRNIGRRGDNGVGSVIMEHTYEWRVSLRNFPDGK